MFRKQVPKSHFQSQFSLSKINRIFQKKMPLRISIQETFFVKNILFLTSIFEPLSFLKSCPIFDNLEALYSRNTMVSIEYIDFWPKSLSALKNFLCFYKGLAERNRTKPGESFSFVNYVNVNYFVKYSTVDCKYVLTSSTIFFL